MSLERRLREARRRLGKTQKEMAAACGVGLSTWQNYEAGVNQPGPGVLARLTGMGISSDWLLTGREPASLDEELLQDVIAGVEAVLTERRQRLAPEKKGRLVVVLYQMFREMDRGSATQEHDLIAKMVGLAS